MNLKIFLILIYGLNISLSAQETELQNLKFTGSLYADSKLLLKEYEQLPLFKMNDEVVSPKSPLLAGVMSAVVPGAGQFYNGDYWKTAIFVVLEGALITTAVVYNKKGDDQNASFEAYADDYTNPDHNWSALRYADWLIEYEYNGQNPGININRDPNLPPWEQVDFNSLNQYEVGSHHLPPHGEQQYYELIGKYHQFSPGWNDFTGGINIDLLSPNMIYYSKERGKANDYYNIGDKAVLGVIINHAASVVEAILAANSFNKDLSLKFRVDDLHLTNRHELIPNLIVKYNF